ncbi:MAG: DUF2726 domain-containing protein [Betaproteobacteria bacterium]|nr:DUF2726 domain-containing protein [Betaproteobacteria bacterium]
MLAYWLLGLAPVVAVAYIVWAYRKKIATRAAVSNERFERMFGTQPQRAPAPASAAVPSASQGRMFSRKERLVSENHGRLLSTLRSAMPEHEVFAHVSLAALVDLSPHLQGREREQRQRALTQYGVDCVICDGDMRIVAAVDLDAGNGAGARFKSECLKAAGISYLRVNPAEMPRDDTLRALLGATFGR